MINVSNAFRERMQYNTNFLPHAVITLENGTILEPEISDFALGGESLVDGAGCSSLPIGAAIEKSLSLELMNDNEQYDSISFIGAKILFSIRFALDDEGETVEEISYGAFTVTEPESYGETVIITAVDDMYRADGPYSTSITFPATIGSLLQDICYTTGILLASQAFYNNGFEVASLPEGQYTYREMIGYIAMIAGGNARINRSGRLEIISYSFDYSSNKNQLAAFKSLRVGLDDVVITGVKTILDDKTEVISGTDGYVLSLTNPLWKGREQTAMALIGAVLIGGRFRDFDGDHIAYPLAEFMDKAELTDRRGRTYNTIITDIDFSIGGLTVLKNSAETPARNSGKYSSPISQVLIKAQELIKTERTQREAAIQALSDTLAQASGLYETRDEQEDHSVIYYLHDKPTLNQSHVVLKLTSSALGLSQDGGHTYPYGLDFSGNAILNKIYAIGIDSQYINVGNQTFEGGVNAMIDTEFSVQADRIASEVAKEVPVLNLLPQIYAYEDAHGNPVEESGLTFVRNADGSVTVTGTATADVWYALSGITVPVSYNESSVLLIDPEKKYTLSGCPAGGSSSTYELCARVTPNGTIPTALSGDVYSDTGSGVMIPIGEPIGYRYAHVYIHIAAGYACPLAGITFEPMYEAGDIRHPYITAVSGTLSQRLRSAESAITQTPQMIEEKVSEVYDTIPIVNLLPPIYASELDHANPYVMAGVTFTRNSNGSVTATGTATGGNAYYDLSAVTIPSDPKGASITYLDSSKKYHLSGCPSGGSPTTYLLGARVTEPGIYPSGVTGTPYHDYGDGVTIPTGYAYAGVYICIIAGYTCPAGGITFYPMFEMGETAHPYTNPMIATLASRIQSAETDIRTNAGEIALKLSQTDFNGNSIIGKINLSSTTAQLDFQRINMDAAEINMTAGNVVIKAGDMTSLTDTTHNGMYLSKDGIAFGKGNARINADGTFQFGAIQSSGRNGGDVWVSWALHVSYGIELYAGNAGGMPYLDFRRDATTPNASTGIDYTARIANNNTNQVTFYGQCSSGGTPAGCTVIAQAFAQTSDRRLKTMIHDLDYAKSARFIRALKPSSYQYISNPDETHHGFVYDEVEAVKGDRSWSVSELIEDALPDGTSCGSVSALEIIPDMVVVMQELMSEVESLRSQLKNIA